MFYNIRPMGLSNKWGIARCNKQGHIIGTVDNQIVKVYKTLAEARAAKKRLLGG